MLCWSRIWLDGRETKMVGVGWQFRCETDPPLHPGRRVRLLAEVRSVKGRLNLAELVRQTYCFRTYFTLTPPPPTYDLL